tara:strand:+ start:4018 stop:4542 length:525 start_codon:yes stop_codon:yes gene_type:complete
MKALKSIVGVFSLVLVVSALGIVMHPHASEVYKSVDESGNVVFTDQSAPQAEPVDIQELNTMAPPVDRLPNVERSGNNGQEPEYSVIITKPEDQQLFPNRLLAFEVTVEVTPRLERGQQLRLLIDGTLHSTGRGSFTVKNLGLGEHSLEVELIMSANKVIARSSAVTIFTRQPG